MAFQKTLAAKNKKQPKPKRSLRKKSFAETHVSEQKELAINLDKSQLDAIFTNLYLGNLQNPQMALGMVYSLALDALEKTLIQGIDELIHSMPGQNSDSQNPFAPWLERIMPRDADKISAFQTSIADKINTAKKSIQERIEKTYQADADGRNFIGKKLQFSSQAIRAFFDQVNENTDVSCVSGHLSQERLHELFNDIQIPLPDDGIKRFHITQTPDHYRFSFGNQPLIKKQSDSVRISSDGDVSLAEAVDECPGGDCEASNAPVCSISPVSASPECSSETGLETLSEAECREMDDTERDVVPERTLSSDISDDSSSSDFSIRLTPDVLEQTLGITHEQTDTLKSEALDIMNMAVEVSEAMKEIAVQIAQATIEAFNEEQFVPSLTEALSNDPRMKEDAELSEFVEQLEAVDAGGVDEDALDEAEAFDNEELANAFGMLLDKLDF